MKRYRLLIIASVVLALFAWDQVANRVRYSPQVVSPTPFPVVQETALNEDRLFDLINQWRKKSGFKTYKKSDFLCKIASIRLIEVKKNYSHDGFSAKRWCREGCTISENLDLIEEGYAEEKDILNDWLNSKKHRENLKKPYSYSCVKTSGSYAVQIFGYY